MRTCVGEYFYLCNTFPVTTLAIKATKHPSEVGENGKKISVSLDQNVCCTDLVHLEGRMT